MTLSPGRQHLSCCSVSKSCSALGNTMNCSTPVFPVHHLSELAQLMSTEWVMPFNHLILCCPVFLLPSIFPSSESFPMSWLFVSGGKIIRASALASVLPVDIQGWFPLELTGLISLQSKGPLSLLQHHSSKASILWHSAWLMVQLSHPCMTTGKTMVLTLQTFVGKVMSLLFNTLSRFVIAFLPRSKHLLFYFYFYFFNRTIWCCDFIYFFIVFSLFILFYFIFLLVGG